MPLNGARDRKGTPMAVRPYSRLQRQTSAAKQLLEAKILEFAAHESGGHKDAAEQARNQAMAALEAHLDLTSELIAAELKKGWSY
tara:strand:+ start:567 stop:821 length:255 start_codon:yes stop_codon:yes gene_type:complete